MRTARQAQRGMRSGRPGKSLPSLKLFKIWQVLNNYCQQFPKIWRACSWLYRSSFLQANIFVLRYRSITRGFVDFCTFANRAGTTRNARNNASAPKKGKPQRRSWVCTVPKYFPFIPMFLLLNRFFFLFFSQLQNSTQRKHILMNFQQLYANICQILKCQSFQK